MILTLMSNKARVEKAAAEAATKAALEQYRTWSEWNNRREAAAALGQDFDEPPPAPPPGLVRNGNGKGTQR